MTQRIGNVVIIEDEPETECELCHKMAETRPYGPGGCRVCFECGMKDEETAIRNFAKFLSGDPAEKLN